MKPLALLLIVGASACATLYAPQSASIPLSTTKYDARPADYPIALLTASLPKCAYDELATVNAFPSIVKDYAPAAELLALMRAEARKIGADAVVRVRQITEDQDNLTTKGTHKSTYYTGTAIRYRDPACRE